MKERPNIILIITDQQRYDTIRALGYNHCITQTWASLLVREQHEQCHVTGFLCTGSGWLTTGYPHTTGILKMQMTGLNRWRYFEQRMLLFKYRQDTMALYRSLRVQQRHVVKNRSFPGRASLMNGRICEK